MLLNPTNTDPVYRLRPTMITNSYGSLTEDWTNPIRMRLIGARIQGDRTAEFEGIEHRLVRNEKVLFAPGSIDLTEDDRIEVAGKVFRVEGPPVIRVGLASRTYTSASLTRLTS